MMASRGWEHCPASIARVATCGTATHVLLRHRLLLQPHGFEGVGTVRVRVPGIDLVAPEPEQMRKGKLDRNAAALCHTAKPHEHHYVRSCHEEILGLRVNL